MLLRSHRRRRAAGSCSEDGEIKGRKEEGITYISIDSEGLVSEEGETKGAVNTKGGCQCGGARLQCEYVQIFIIYIFATLNIT